MKKIVGLIALAAMASPAIAQNFRLDLSLTARSVSGPSGSETVQDIQTGGIVNATAGTTYRVELRYRIQDLTADTTGSRGLSSAAINISQSGSGTGNPSRSFLTFDQTGTVNIPAGGTDSSGITTFGDGPNTGLISEFRGGLVLDTDPANGGPNGLGQIVPLALSAFGNNSWASGNPSAANTNSNTNVWAIYTFEFVYQGGTVNFLASAQADAGTGNRFGYFARTGGTNNPIPQSSNLATDGGISFVPAPATMALLGLGGLVAGRRRRA